MSIQFKRFATLAGMAALATTALHTGPAAAQSATYCSGTLVANSFYSNVLPGSNGGADVEYHGQFQNQDSKRRPVSVTLIEIVKVGNFTFVKKVNKFALGPYEQKDIALATVHTANQGGTGAPTPAQMSKNLRLSCAFS